jgi:hypothetical protein
MAAQIRSITGRIGVSGGFQRASPAARAVSAPAPVMRLQAHQASRQASHWALGGAEASATKRSSSSAVAGSVRQPDGSLVVLAGQDP